jgi:hypothetical protein
MKIAVLAISAVLLISLFFVGITASTSYTSEEYDPQYDFDNDGDIDIVDVVKVAIRYGSTGIPTNDSDISELLSKIDSLNTSLLETQERLVELEEIVYREPTYPILGDGRDYHEALLLTLDVDPAFGFQDTVQVAPGENVTVNIAFDIWEPRGSSIINQVFLIYSWTPLWPPPTEYYYALCDGYPGVFGGTIHGLFNITAPTNPGNYSIWFCAAEEYSMSDAVGTFTSQPTRPALIQITVENQ